MEYLLKSLCKEDIRSHTSQLTHRTDLEAVVEPDRRLHSLVSADHTLDAATSIIKHQHASGLVKSIYA